MNAITLINVDMAWKAPDMAPAATIVMIVVAGSVIEVDAGGRVVIVVVPGFLVDNDSAHMGSLITNGASDIIGVIAAGHSD
jgi:hypothetical protein